MKQVKVRIPIFVKLIGIILFLLLCAVLSLEQISTRLYTEDSTGLIQQMNSDTVTAVAGRTRGQFESISEKARIFGAILLWEWQNHTPVSLAKKFLEKEKDLTALFLFESSKGEPRKVLHAAFTRDIQITEKFTDQGLKLFSFEDGIPGEKHRDSIEVDRAKTPDNRAALALSLPLTTASMDASGKSYSVLAIAPLARFQDAIDNSGASLVYIIDKEGDAILHAEGVSGGKSVADHPLVAKLTEGKTSNGLLRYLSPGSGEYFLGAYRQVGFGGLGVFAEVPESKALAPAIRIQYRSALLAIIVISLGSLLGFWFAESISGRLRKIVDAAHLISRGDFKIRLHSKSRDELQTLSDAFNEMAAGLEERERVKSVFNKFHSKEVADKLLSGEVKLGGERRNAIILFNDIRQFTTLAENLRPEAVIELLNEYMARMVNIIQKHGGVVDKYVGDAIMALWGVPESKGTDAYQAVYAALEIRVELGRFNKERIAKGLPVLRIGTGINYGTVIAGNIGSTERMEYTVIGDAVNLASRLESLTKEVGTDLLISKSVLQLTQRAFYVESCGQLPVKGKNDTVEVFKVLGYYAKDGKVILVQTPYSDVPVTPPIEKPSAA